MTGCSLSNCALRHLLSRQLASVLTAFWTTLDLLYGGRVRCRGRRDTMNAALMNSKRSFGNVAAAPRLLVCTKGGRFGAN